MARARVAPMPASTTGRRALPSSRVGSGAPGARTTPMVDSAAIAGGGMKVVSVAGILLDVSGDGQVHRTRPLRRGQAERLAHRGRRPQLGSIRPAHLVIGEIQQLVVDHLMGEELLA